MLKWAEPLATSRYLIFKFIIEGTVVLPLGFSPSSGKRKCPKARPFYIDSKPGAHHGGGYIWAPWESLKKERKS